jgi:hypothetical protein
MGYFWTLVNQNAILSNFVKLKDPKKRKNMKLKINIGIEKIK